jgi:hypothetical protein
MKRRTYKNKKMTKRNKNRKSIKRVYKRRVTIRKGGDCGCNKPLLWGGDTLASYNSDLQPNTYYPLNPQLNDSNDPSILLNSRNLPNMSSSIGGKRRHKKGGKRVRISRKLNQINGGGISDYFLGANPSNHFLSSMTSPGVLDTYNTYNMRADANPAPYIQPSLVMYNDNNLPLV